LILWSWFASEKEVPVQVESVEYKFIDTPRWGMRITIIGRGFEQRAIPIVAQVGDQSVEALMPLLNNDGVMGFLAREPTVGDEVRVGFADGPLIDTGITYNRPAE